MTENKPNNQGPLEGILRSKPRYSPKDNRPDDLNIGALEGPFRVDDGHTSAGETPVDVAHEKGSVNMHMRSISGDDKKTRSLADLVRCSMNLTNESLSIPTESGTSAPPVSATRKTQREMNFGGGGDSGDTITGSYIAEDENIIRTGKDDTSKRTYDTSPVLGSVERKGKDKRLTSEKNEVEIEHTEGNRRLRFSHSLEECCEDTSINKSSRDRIEQRIIDVQSNILTIDPNEDDKYTSPGVDEKKEDDISSQSSSDGSADDYEILADLGLSNLIPVDSSDQEHFNSLSFVENNLVTEKEPEPRSFRILWQTLCNWVTPKSISLVRQYQNDLTRSGDSNINELCSSSKTSIIDRTPSNTEGNESSPTSRTRNTVDIGASRRAGIMSMLKMNISRSLSELKHSQMTHHQKEKLGEDSRLSTSAKTNLGLKPSVQTVMHHSFQPNMLDALKMIDQRSIEQRLANLINTFNTSGPAANLNAKMWKGMTTVLIAIVYPAYVVSRFEICDALTNGDREESLMTAEDRTSLELIDLLPPSVASLGLTIDEYHYLIRSAVLSLET